MKVAIRFHAVARLLIGPLTGAVLLASASHAAPAPRATSKSTRVTKAPARTAARAAAPSAASRIAAGQVIGIDPETGRVGDVTPEQMAQLAAELRARELAPATHAAPVHHADGRVSMYVGNWMREYSVVRIGANGRPVLGCVDGRDAKAYLDHHAPAPAGPEER